MNTNGMAKHYSQMTVDERFRLILAAVSRGDDVEKDRLMSAGQKIKQTIWDVVPSVQAFVDLQNSTYIELLALAAQFHGLIARTEKLGGEDINTVRAQNNASVEYSALHRTGRAAFGLGFILKLKFEGWRLFCEGLQVSPLLMWEQPNLPGFHQVMSAVDMASAGIAFPSAAEMARWMDEAHPRDGIKRTEANVQTAAGLAAELDAEFRERVRFWGG